MKLEFNSRDTYLAQVALWKAAYAQLSQQIRDTRRAFRQAQSDYSKNKGPWAAIERRRGEVDQLRAEANAMLADRHAAKVEAHEQWLATRQPQLA